MMASPAAAEPMAIDLNLERTRLAEALGRDRLRLTRFVRAKLSSASDLDAEDVVSDVVLRLFEQADVLAQVENVTAYLFRALGNKVIDLFRRRRVVEDLSEEYEDPAATPEANLEQLQLRHSLDAALDRLRPAERAVWVAVEVEGWSFRDLADRWNLPIGTLLSRKSRATKALRIALAAEGRERGLAGADAPQPLPHQ